MKFRNDWISLAPPPESIPDKAIVLRQQTLAAGYIFPIHTHEWHQLVFSTAGAYVAGVGENWYVATTEHAIWIPKGVPHTSGTLNGAQFLNLYIQDQPQMDMPDKCAVLQVSDLLKALITELSMLGVAASRRYEAVLHDMILEHLKKLPETDFYLPWPQQGMLKSICDALFLNPTDTRTMREWGQELGASSRTLARRFERELGMTFGEWRQKLKLFLAVEWLSKGEAITNIALNLGYSSTAAFSYMFRQAMGTCPSDWRQEKLKVGGDS